MATKKPKKLKLTIPMLTQISSYAGDCEENGWYYGNKNEFWKRHEAIKARLKQEITARAKSEPRNQAERRNGEGPRLQK